MEIRNADVLVIGSGGAGVMAAVEAARAGASDAKKEQPHNHAPLIHFQ